MNGSRLVSEKYWDRKRVAGVWKEARVVDLLIECVLEHLCKDGVLSERGWVRSLAHCCKRLAEEMRKPAYFKQWNMRYTAGRPWYIPYDVVDMCPTSGVEMDGGRPDGVDAASYLSYAIVSARLSRCGRFAKVMYQDARQEWGNDEFLHGFKLMVSGAADERYSQLALFWDPSKLQRYAAVAMGHDVERDGMPTMKAMFNHPERTEQDRHLSDRMETTTKYSWTHLSGDVGQCPIRTQTCILPWKHPGGVRYYGRMSYYMLDEDPHSSFVVFSTEPLSNPELTYQREYRSEVVCQEPFLCDAERNALYVVSGNGTSLERFAPCNLPSDRLLRDVVRGPEFNGRAICKFLQRFSAQEAQKLMLNGQDFRKAKFHPSCVTAGYWLIKRTQDVTPVEDSTSTNPLTMAELREIVVKDGFFETVWDIMMAVHYSTNIHVIAMLLMDARREFLEAQEFEDGRWLAQLIRSVLNVWRNQVCPMDALPARIIVSLLSLAKEDGQKRAVVAIVEEAEDAPFLCCLVSMPPLDLLRDELLPLVDLRAHFEHRSFKDLPFLCTWVDAVLGAPYVYADQRDSDIKAMVVAMVDLGYPINAMGRKTRDTLFSITLEHYELDLAVWMLEEFKYARLEPRLGMDYGSWKFDFGTHGKRLLKAMEQFMNDGGAEPWVNVGVFLCSKARKDMAP